MVVVMMVLVHVMDLLLTWRWWWRGWSWSRIMGYIKHISWTLKNNLCYYEMMMIKIKNRFFFPLHYSPRLRLSQFACWLLTWLWQKRNTRKLRTSTQSSVRYYWYAEKKTIVYGVWMFVMYVCICFNVGKCK